MAKQGEHASREMVTQLREGVGQREKAIWTPLYHTPSDGRTTAEEFEQREKAIARRLSAEEGELFLDEHPEDKGGGFYERSLLTSCGLTSGLGVSPRKQSCHKRTSPGPRAGSPLF